MTYRYFFNVEFIDDAGNHGSRNFQLELDSQIESLTDVESATAKIKALVNLRLAVITNFILLKVF